MSRPLDSARQAALLRCFRLPPPQTMVARKSTLTNAFVSALIPSIEPSLEEIDEALTILALDPIDLRCGSRYDTWDHLRPLVTSRRPTGYITEIANLVPACGRCNSSKGSSHWKKWMMGAAKGSPRVRQIPDIELRADRLTVFENWKHPIKVDFGAILGEHEWHHYWSLCEAVVEDLRAAQAVADALKERIKVAIKTTP